MVLLEPVSILLLLCTPQPSFVFQQVPMLHKESEFKYYLFVTQMSVSWNYLLLPDQEAANRRIYVTFTRGSYRDCSHPDISA